MAGPFGPANSRFSTFRNAASTSGLKMLPCVLSRRAFWMATVSRRWRSAICWADQVGLGERDLLGELAVELHVLDDLLEELLEHLGVHPHGLRRHDRRAAAWRTRARRAPRRPGRRRRRDDISWAILLLHGATTKRPAASRVIRSPPDAARARPAARRDGRAARLEQPAQEAGLRRVRQPRLRASLPDRGPVRGDARPADARPRAERAGLPGRWLPAEGPGRERGPPADGPPAHDARSPWRWACWSTAGRASCSGRGRRSSPSCCTPSSRRSSATASR